jgi:hypothetical protein
MDSVAANGFECRFLHEWEARALCETGYMALTDISFLLLEAQRWRDPYPIRATRDTTRVMREDSIWDPENNIKWMNFFCDQCNMELAKCKGNGTSPLNKNTAARKAWEGGLPGPHHRCW